MHTFLEFLREKDFFSDFSQIFSHKMFRECVSILAQVFSEQRNPAKMFLIRSEICRKNEDHVTRGGGGGGSEVMIERRHRGGSGTSQTGGSVQNGHEQNITLIMIIENQD